MKKFTVGESATLKNFTDSIYPQGSFAFSRLLRDKDIRVNGVKTGENVSLSAGDEIVYYTTLREESLPAFERVYEDDRILVVDKYAGVNSEALFATLAAEGELYFIHRLDRNTAGLMAFAKTKGAERALLAAFAERRAEKKYLAICFHPFRRDHEILQDYLVKDERAARVKVFSSFERGAEKITTEYRVLERSGEYSLVEVTLHSGKTHQIRAHLSFHGNPVAGDEKYGDEALNRKYKVKRQLLIARSLRFDLPAPFADLSLKTFLSGFSFDGFAIKRT